MSSDKMKKYRRGKTLLGERISKYAINTKRIEYTVSMADQKINLLGLMADFLGLLAVLMHCSWYLWACLQVKIIPNICSMERGKRLKSETSAAIIEYSVC